MSTVVPTTFTVGQLVGRIGAASYHQTGKITQVNVSAYYGSTLFTNQMYTNVYQTEGDSGGIVYAPYNNYTLGIGTFRDENYNMLFSRADKINSVFGITRY